MTTKHGLNLHRVLLEPLVKGDKSTAQSTINGKCLIYSINMYIKNYICSIFESWRVLKLSRLDSLNSASIVAGDQD